MPGLPQHETVPFNINRYVFNIEGEKMNVADFDRDLKPADLPVSAVATKTAH